MSLILTQTDVEAACADSIGCSGGVLGPTPQGKQATEGGTAGVTEIAATGVADANRVMVMFNSAAGEPGVTSWAAGPYVVRINLTTGTFIGNWEDTYVCRFSAACGSLATVGSLTAQAIDITEATGVFSMTVTGALQTAGVGDVLYIVLIFSNSSAGGLDVTFTPDQNIDTPIVVVAADENIHTRFHRYARQEIF